MKNYTDFRVDPELTDSQKFQLERMFETIAEDYARIYDFDFILYSPTALDENNIPYLPIIALKSFPDWRTRPYWTPLWANKTKAGLLPWLHECICTK